MSRSKVRKMQINQQDIQGSCFSYLCINEAIISIKFHVRNAIAVGHITFGGDSEGTSKMGGTFFEEI